MSWMAVPPRLARAVNLASGSTEPRMIGVSAKESTSFFPFCSKVKVPDAPSRAMLPWVQVLATWVNFTRYSPAITAGFFPPARTTPAPAPSAARATAASPTLLRGRTRAVLLHAVGAGDENGLHAAHLVFLPRHQ